MNYPNIIKINKLQRSHLCNIVYSALKEDIGKTDITTELIIPKNKYIKASVLAKEDCIVCGLDIARLVFKLKDKKIKFNAKIKDGQFIKKATVLAKIGGQAISILTAERVALNFLSLLSGIATTTRLYVNKIKPYKVKIMDTRKTIPGLREIEKYAVRIGGGYNHRFRLDEMALIKDNHIQVMGYGLWVMGLKELRNKISSEIKIEIEVKNLEEFKEALKLKPDIIMLDNMSIKDIKKAVKIRIDLSLNPYHLTPKLEASGGITLKNIRKIAACGVDMISVGALTDSIKSIDMSLEVL